jgi:hypothetical protein
LHLLLQACSDRGRRQTRTDYSRTVVEAEAEKVLDLLGGRLPIPAWRLRCAGNRRQPGDGDDLAGGSDRGRPRHLPSPVPDAPRTGVPHSGTAKVSQPNAAA